MLKVWAIAGLVAVQIASGAATEAQRELLRRSDVSTLTPPSFVARLVLTAGAEATPHAIDIWRSGTDRLLVRFLDGGERGRYLLRRGADLWLVTPLAKRPVKLPPSYRLYGGFTIDEILGIRLAADYHIDSVAEPPGDPPQTVFELRAAAPAAIYPRVRYVVDRRSGRPVTAAYALASGKVATTATFAAWSEVPVLHPSRLTIRDELRKGREGTVAITSLRAVDIPEAVFELDGHEARARLAGDPAPPPSRPDPAEAEPLEGPAPDRPFELRGQLP